jgi:hypothetical protein
MLQAGRSPVRVPNEVDFFNLPNAPAALWPWSRFSVYQKWVPGIFLGVKGGRRVRLTVSPPSVSWLSRECGKPQPLTILRASTICTGITLPYLYNRLDVEVRWTIMTYIISDLRQISVSKNANYRATYVKFSCENGGNANLLSPLAVRV